MGKTDWEIATILGISVETAHQYVKRARAAYDDGQPNPAGSSWAARRVDQLRGSNSPGWVNMRREPGPLSSGGAGGASSLARLAGFSRLRSIARCRPLAVRLGMAAPGLPVPQRGGARPLGPCFTRASASAGSLRARRLRAAASRGARREAGVDRRSAPLCASCGSGGAWRPRRQVRAGLGAKLRAGRRDRHGCAPASVRRLEEHPPRRAGASLRGRASALALPARRCGLGAGAAARLEAPSRIVPRPALLGVASPARGPVAALGPDASCP